MATVQELMKQTDAMVDEAGADGRKSLAFIAEAKRLCEEMVKLGPHVSDSLERSSLEMRIFYLGAFIRLAGEPDYKRELPAYDPNTSATGILMVRYEELDVRLAEASDEDLPRLIEEAKAMCKEMAALGAILPHSSLRHSLYEALRRLGQDINHASGDIYRWPLMEKYDPLAHSNALLERLAEEREFPGFVEEAKQLCEALADMGSKVTGRDRSTLRAKLTYWASHVRSSSGELYHEPKLAEYAPPA